MFYAKTFARMLQNIFSRIEHGIKIDSGYMYNICKKMFCNTFANVLAKSVKRLQFVLEMVTCKIKQ